MGMYLNPGNRGFQEILQSEYVDKTGLIALVNKTVGTMEKLSCISRPRRFGKSYAAKMLCAYYDCSCDSHSLFDDKEIARRPGYLDQKRLCEGYGMNFEDARRWYDGYDFPEVGAIYNPYSVMLAMRKKKFGSYWQRTSAAESLMSYINMDFEGLQETISRLISGEKIEVDTESFENDFETFKCCDDVLTLLIHLGYLTWHEEDGTAHIPNDEVRSEFRKILKGRNVNRKWMELISRSRKLLEDTIAGNESAVAKAMEEIRDTQYAPTFYNDEQALRYVIKFAYIAAIDQYLKIEELPSEKGIADVVYLPKPKSMLPALLIELKWNKSSEGALNQIKSRNYPAMLKDYGGEIVMVGINYNEKTKDHSCKIERV